MTSADRRLRICVVSQQYRRVVSGIGVHARNLTHRLHADGHNVHLLVPADEAPVDAPFPVTTVPPAKSSTPIWLRKPSLPQTQWQTGS